MKINSSEAEWVGLSTADEVGRVFIWQNRLFRAIFNDKLDAVRRLISSGMLDELVEQNLIPRTHVTGYAMDGFGMVLEHRRVRTLSYPYEWSFEMLRDAALTVLRINIIARKYGYQMKDCHAFNVVFEGTNPVYVDIGSFVPATDESQWVSYEEFLRSYYYLLRIGSSNDYHWVRQLQTADGLISHESYLLYQYPLLRRLGKSFTGKMSKARFLYKNGRLVSTEHRGALARPVAKIYNTLRRSGLLPFSGVNLEKLAKRVSGIRKATYETAWGNYHSEFHESALRGNYRFERIIELLQGRDIKTVFEVAGNQGFFSRMMLERLDLDYVCCSDYDENAVDVMYRLNKGNARLSPVLTNFLFPNVTTFTEPPHRRFSADLVVALAVTHHILLSQNVPLEFLLTSLKRFTCRFIAVEFMPLGLWDGRVAQPMPAWYTQDWFRAGFSAHFDLICEEKIEENRVIFLGELKQA